MAGKFTNPRQTIREANPNLHPGFVREASPADADDGCSNPGC